MFTTEFLLRVSPQQSHILAKRFEAARMVYNAILGEALKRYDLTINDSEFKVAKAAFLATKQTQGRIYRALLLGATSRIISRKHNAIPNNLYPTDQSFN